MDADEPVTDRPPAGGETMWSSMYAAYDALSPHMQKMLDGMQILNNNDRVRFLEPLEQIHPAVVVNPITGRKCLFVDPNYTSQRYSFVSLEGFINGKVIVEGLRRAGPDPTRRGFRQALESLHDLDLGIGAPLSFGRNHHQGLDSVYFTHVEKDRWVPVADWNAVMTG